MTELPNTGFENFAVSIASPVAAKEQQSKEAETTANTYQKVVIKLCDYYASHKTTCSAHMQSRYMCVKNRTRSYISPMRKVVEDDKHQSGHHLEVVPL